GYAAGHPLHVGNELRIRSGALDEEGNRAPFGAETRHLSDAGDSAAAEVGIHFKVKGVARTYGAGTGQHAKSGDGEIDILRACTVGRNVNVGAKVLNVGVIPTYGLARKCGDRLQPGTQIETGERGILQTDRSGSNKSVN